MIRVLIAEDSAVTREYLVYLISQDPVLQVVGTARNGLEALEQAERFKPDVILMDVHMPRMNGYAATRQIMERVPTPIVMVTASLSRDEVAMTFEALKAGALTVMDKPGGPEHPGHEEDARRLLETVKLMAEVKVVRRWPRRERPVPPSPLRPYVTGRSGSSSSALRPAGLRCWRRSLQNCRLILESLSSSCNTLRRGSSRGWPSGSARKRASR